MGESSRLDELRGLVQERRYVAAVRLAKALIDGGALDPSEMAEVRHVCAVAFYKQEKVLDALTEEEHAHRIATEWNLPNLLLRVRVSLVAMLVDAGEYHKALDVGGALLGDENSPAGASQLLPYVHFNTARAHYARRDKQKAFDHFREAVRLGEEHGAPAALMVQIRQLFAWRLYLEERITEADRQVAEAGALIEEGDEEGQSEQLLLSCLRSYQTGDTARAVELAEEFVAEGAPATDTQRAWAYLLLGWASLDLGRLDDAATFAHEVVERAIGLNHPELMNRGNQLQHRVHAKRESAG